MGSIRITEFGGMKPRDHRGIGPSSRAALAKDVKLWHGSLRPWRYPGLKVASDLEICKIYQSECCFVTSDNPCASFTTADTNCHRVFSTGVMDWPAYADLPDCTTDCGEIPDLEWFRLGVPRPTGHPNITNVTLSDPEQGCESCVNGVQLKRETRAYYYTFVNKYGEESRPSDIDSRDSVDIDSDATLGLNIAPMTGGYEDPEFIRIYRGGSGWSEEGEWDQGAPEFFLVAEIPFQTGNFTYLDDLPASQMAEVRHTDCHHVPRTDLQSITETGEGSLVAFEGKNLWFSEPWKFNAWECHLNLDDCIQGIVVSSNYIYVATNGNPYVISIKNNDDDCKCCREVVKIETYAPIACRKSLVATHNGAMWASNTGLVQVTGTQLQIETHSFLAEDDWLEWFPHDLTGVFYKGMYLGFNAERGFIWDMNDSVYSDTYPGDSGKFTELSLTPTAVFVSKQNFMYMAFEGGIHQWDNAAESMPYTWRSSLNIEGGLQNFSAMKIVFEKWLRTRRSPNPITMRLYADDKLVFTRSVSCSRPFRLPKGYDALNWEIELTGVESVIEMHMATSMKELVLINNA